MRIISLLLLAAWAVLLPACEAPEDATRLSSLRGTVEALVGSQVTMLQREKARLKYEVVNGGNRPEHLPVVDRATRVCRATQGLLDRLDTLQRAFIVSAGSSAAPHPDHTRRFYPAREYRVQLVHLERELRGLVAMLEPGTARRAAVMVGPEGAVARLRGGKRSLAVALALLWELKLETVGCARAGLESLRASLAREEEMLPYPVVDIPALLPEGESLHVGVVLRGFMPRPSTGVLEMTCNGTPVPVADGMGKVRFVAQGPPGTRQWEAAIRIKHPYLNRDTVFRATQTYRVLPR